jgi:hypothetical protein
MTPPIRRERKPGPLRKLCQPKSVSAVGSGGYSALGSVKSESANVTQ